MRLTPDNSTLLISHVPVPVGKKINSFLLEGKAQLHVSKIEGQEHTELYLVTDIDTGTVSRRLEEHQGHLCDILLWWQEHLGRAAPLCVYGNVNYAFGNGEGDNWLSITIQAARRQYVFTVDDDGISLASTGVDGDTCHRIRGTNSKDTFVKAIGYMAADAMIST